MKIYTNYIPNIAGKSSYSIGFTSNVESGGESIQSAQLQNIQPDYNVRVPIAYNHIDDIKLDDGVVAKHYKLANGQNVVIVPKKGTTVIKSYVNTGSFNEPDNLRGISHYIEHNLFNGSEDLGDKVFFDEVNQLGASTNASTGFANTNYYISSNLLEDTDLEDEIKLHAGMLQSPKFLLEKLEKEKDIVNSEINMCLSENENLGLTQTIKNLFDIKSTSLDLVAGSTDNITALTRDDVVNYFNNNYYPANITTVITGDVDPDETIKLISKYFNSNKTPSGQRFFEKMIPTEKAIRQDIISPKSESDATHIFVGFAGPENNNAKDKIYLKAAAMFACGLYESRFSDLERKYGNFVSIYPERLSSRPQDPCAILLDTVVSDEKSEDVINQIYKIIDSLSKFPPTDDELKTIKNLMKKSNHEIYEESASLNSNIGNAFLNNNIAYIKDYSSIVDSMTPDDIVKVAQKYLDLNKAALTVVHPNGTKAESINNNYNKVKSVSFSGRSDKNPINMDDIATYRAKNNIDIVLRNANSDIIQYSFAIEEPQWTIKKAILASILSDIFENAGTTSKTANEVAKEADKYAIRSDIYATDTGLIVDADFPVDTAKESLSFIKDKVLNPNFTQEEFQASVARLKDLYNSQEVDPYDNFNAAIYKDTPIGVTRKEKLASLDEVTLEDVKQYYKEIFENGQAKAVITAPIGRHPEVKQLLFNSISSYDNVKPWNIAYQKIYTPVEKTEVYTDINLKNQADIIEGFKYRRSGNIKDEVCVSILNEILGGSPSSRLFMDLRESRHLAYSVSSNYINRDDLGVFELSIGTTTENQETGEKTFDNVQKAIDGFNENINKIKTEKVTEAELNSAKKKIKSDLLDFLETNSGKNFLLSMSKNTPYEINYINELYNNIDSVTVDDIYVTANNIFNSKPIYSITATKDTLDANKEYLESLKN